MIVKLLCPRRERVFYDSFLGGGIRNQRRSTRTFARRDTRYYCREVSVSFQLPRVYIPVEGTGQTATSELGARPPSSRGTAGQSNAITLLR